jgi:bifunctional polynucleotide phosphatase/kinase
MNPKMTINWSENNNYLKGILNHSKALNDPIRIAGFDLDDTIIHKPSGKSKVKLVKWKLVNMDIIPKIKRLLKHKYIIVIFTNQAGMTGKNFNKMQWRQAMNELIKFLFREIPDFYVAVYVAKNYDMYRKPNLGMWQLMKTDLKKEFGLTSDGSGLTSDGSGLAGKLRISKKSFYVGDAAGRIDRKSVV